MFDINGSEVIVLAIVAVVLLGPDKLPDLARKLARVIKHLRGIADNAQNQVRRELGPEFDDLQLSDLNPRSFITRQINETRADIERGINSEAPNAVSRPTSGTSGQASSYDDAT